MPENKVAIEEYRERYPHTADRIIAELKSEDFFVNIRYGTAYDVQRICKIDFLGHAFLDK
tara:strand:- start:195 stop:374 length:180 start_codon:yes stop_codon:yes gene_type:complete